MTITVTVMDIIKILLIVFEIIAIIVMAKLLVDSIRDLKDGK